MSQQFQFVVTPADARQRLDVFLAARLGNLSRIRIANLLAAGVCRVNQEIQRAGYHLTRGDCVEITIPDTDAPTAMTPENIPLHILYEDDEIVVVNKPSGMLVHPTRNTKTGTLLNALAYHLNQERLNNLDATSEQTAIIRPGLVHRLDRATSGLMVIAKTQRALSILTKHFHHKRVLKRYVALVHGQIAEDKGTIVAPIGEDYSRQPPRWVMPEGKDAETRFTVIERMRTATLVELEPVTGRTNQLRIHLAYIGHPILGDTIYGGGGVRGSEFGVTATVDTKDQEDTLGEGSIDLQHPPTIRTLNSEPRTPNPMIRLCLHAARLEIHKPSGGEWLQFQAPLPDEISMVLQQLRDAKASKN